MSPGETVAENAGEMKANRKVKYPNCLNITTTIIPYTYSKIL
jgi:hypothetical protein